MTFRLLVGLFYQLPEGVFLALAGLGLFGIKTPRPKIALVGICYGLLIPIVRAVGVPLGLHTVILMSLFVLLSVVILRIRALTALASWMIAVYLLSLGEQFVFLPLLNRFGPDVPTVLANPWLHIMWGWVSASLLVIVAVVVTTTRVVLIPAPEAIQEPVRG
jgi:hypothetical protein